jgi:hypothetical protein
MVRKVFVHSHGGRFELSSTRILDRDRDGKVLRYISKAEIRRALKALVMPPESDCDYVIVKLKYQYRPRYNNEIPVSRTFYDQEPEFLLLHIGCQTFMGNEATKIIKWANKKS